MSTASTATVSGLMAEIAHIGTDPARGGYSRPVYSAAELELREWFLSAATERSLEIETDRNGIIWAWWNPAGLAVTDAVVTGSHLDSVPGGGAFDGPLGVASALVAVDELTASGLVPSRPLALAVFPEEEGSRYGLACLGSQLMTGRVSRERAWALTGADGETFADLATRNGLDPRYIGRDQERLDQIGCFVELHVEQGRGLVDTSSAIAIGSAILGHGRWLLSFRGQGNHAGTTLMTDRHDPMIAAAATVLDVRRLGAAVDGARATVGKLDPVPGGSNVIASRVDVWLDVRHSDDAVVAALVADIAAAARAHALAENCEFTLTEASMSPRVDFDPQLRGRVSSVLPDAPILPTGAGHDAGVLKDEIPTAMLFVRNPTGVSHSPEEYVEDPDADAGGHALATVLTDLLS
ncbi:allantoate amidohydrolase [Gordonia desulfuricans]|uniref:Allantoate amidohydrolase n=1 Tax=Gordonia desulfuricans TaxID=89051 RepID=A0A7K3LRP1_9ACTN|nr:MULTISPECIES: allantoate amidohydrolase [Gordonia]NDK90923.1 allantoate amidohydrolase [Gordonia desulfuricans]WLP92434.1 allantoate amidohydrolase [Gordonia sp. NB41Y]